jgi:hypothetical protein
LRSPGTTESNERGVTKPGTCRAFCLNRGAFSGEVDTGSPQQTRQNQKSVVMAQTPQDMNPARSYSAANRRGQ